MSLMTYRNWYEQKPCAWYIMVKIRDVDTTSTGGLTLTDTLHNQMEYTCGEGTVVAVGPTAWKAFTVSNRPWAKVGDTVIFNSHKGLHYEFLDENGDMKAYRVIKDDDITMTLPKPLKERLAFRWKLIKSRFFSKPKEVTHE